MHSLMPLNHPSGHTYGRTLAMTLKHLRIGFYGGVPRVGVERWATTNVAGCVRAAYDEMGK